MILQFLPLLRGWGWRAIDIDRPAVVKAGEEYVIEEITKISGWLWMASAEVDYPYCQITVTYMDALGKKHTINMMPYGPYHGGMLFSNAFGLTAGVYDQDEERYVANFLPVSPTPYKGYVKLSLVAPPTRDVTLLAFHAAIVEIVNEEEFRRSVKELLGSEKI